jgi:hypothetical protein
LYGCPDVARAVVWEIVGAWRMPKVASPAIATNNLDSLSEEDMLTQ